MKGYKGMDANMRCRGMQYEVGKTYHVDGDINVCSNGLHFCERLTDVFDYYERDGNRFFEVEADGIIDSDGKKSAASELKIIRELTDIEINRTVYGNGNGYGDGYGYVLFGLSAVTWTIFHILDFFSKEDDSGRLYRIYYRPTRRRDRLLVRGRTRRIRRAVRIFRRLRRRI